jgi:hypothetical protein
MYPVFCKKHDLLAMNQIGEIEKKLTGHQRIQMYVETDGSMYFEYRHQFHL